MLLLENEREANATLQDALAFIDAFEGDATEADAGTVEIQRAQKMQQRSASAPKRLPYRDRIRCELQHLRNEVKMLEATLKRAKLAPLDSTQCTNQLAVKQILPQLDSHITVDKWMEIVVHEYRRRRQAEKTNRQLRDLLAKQIKISRTLETALSYKVTDDDLTALYGSQQAAFQDIALEQSLTSRVHQLRMDTDMVLDRAGLNSVASFGCRSQRLIDSNLEICFETTGSVPLSNSLEHTHEQFWNHLVLNNAKIVKNDLDEFHNKRIQVKFEQQTFELPSKATIRKYVEPDRVIYIWTSSMSLPCEGWTFAEDSIIVMRRAGSPAQSIPTSKVGSLFQSWYRISVKESSWPSGSHLLRENIMRFLSNRACDHFKMVAESLDQPIHRAVLLSGTTAASIDGQRSYMGSYSATQDSGSKARRDI